ncbi:MAG: AsnC family protein [Dehalococcoidia bacterium]|nr:AsnC family protein [Dehalococcoidia bacterium]
MLARRLCGRSEGDIGDELGGSPSSVHRRIEKLYDGVFVPLGIKPDGWLCAWWVAMHYECCTKRVFALIENSEESFKVS